MRVLIVDDDDVVARMFKAVLRQAGHEVDAVNDGDAAVAQLIGRDYDVVVCDWMLPGRDGPEVIRELRAQARPQPRVILVSALGGPQARSHALGVGADEYLVKPVAAATLVATVAAPAARGAVPRAARLAKRAVAATEATTGDAAVCAALRATPTWSELERLIAAALSDAIGAAFEPTPALTAANGLTASLAMLDVGHLLEFRLGVTVTGAAGCDLGRRMLRNPSPTAITVRELLGDLCNNVLGATKTALRSQAYQFTLGLADVAGAIEPRDLERDFAPLTSMGFGCEGTYIGVAFGTRVVPSAVVSCEQLRENMVIVENVFNGAGSLLVPAGTRLTSSAAERLTHHLGNGVVRVCELD